MEKKRQLKKKNHGPQTLEDSVIKFFERGMAKSIKRRCSYYSRGIKMSFMRNEIVDLISRMNPHEVTNVLNSPEIRNALLVRMGEILYNLTTQEKKYRINKAKLKIRRERVWHRMREQEKKRKEAYKKANKEKLQAINAVKKKLPKEELEKLYKHFPVLKNDWKPQNY